VTSASEAASDLSSEAIDVHAMSNASPDSFLQCENREKSEEAPHVKTRNVYTEDVLSKPENIDCSSEGTAGDSTQIAEELDKEESEIINSEGCLNDLGKRISANNLEVDEDGTSVIWTR
jgi:hypothetical protein